MKYNHLIIIFFLLQINFKKKSHVFDVVLVSSYEYIFLLSFVIYVCICEEKKDRYETVRVNISAFFSFLYKKNTSSQKGFIYINQQWRRLHLNFIFYNMIW
jgi:hypothetical protein